MQSAGVHPPFDFRSHDYRWLIRRWRAVAKTTGLRVVRYHEENGFPYFYLESKRIDSSLPSIYLSAGIHGDESAATEGLLAWATRAESELHRCNILIFPCLNPWGLMNNRRTNADGVDLNRSYHDDSVPSTRAHKAVLAVHQFDLALTMHEDYDARGIYLYEIQKTRPFWGEALLAAAGRVIPVDHRKTIEGSRAKNGLIRRRISPDFMDQHPEAFILHFQNSRRTFTVETPSEHHLEVRISAQVAVIEEAVRLCQSAFQAR